MVPRTRMHADEILLCRLGNHYDYFHATLMEVAVKATCLSTRVSLCRLGKHYDYFPATSSAGSFSENDSCVNESRGVLEAAVK